MVARMMTSHFLDASSTSRPVPVRQMPSAFHPREQRNAFRRRDARLQRRLFVRENPRLRRSPKLQPALLRLSAIISQYLILCRAWLLSVEQPG